MVEQFDEERYSLNIDQGDSYVPERKAESDSEMESSDEDSIFEEDQPKGLAKYWLSDKAKGREVREGSRVKAQITKVIVTDESIICTVKML
jgi:hypothetical protein